MQIYVRISAKADILIIKCKCVLLIGYSQHVKNVKDNEHTHCCIAEVWNNHIVGLLTKICFFF